MRISRVLCGAALLTLASAAAHADNNFGLHDNGSNAQFTPSPQYSHDGQQWDRRERGNGQHDAQHAQMHRDDRHQRDHAEHWREERHRDTHAQDHHDPHQDSGSVFDSRRPEFHS